MANVSCKQARQNFAQLIETARRGTPVTITRRGREVAKLTGIAPSHRPGLPDLAVFRAALKSCQRGRSVTIAHLRRAERA